MLELTYNLVVNESRSYGDNFLVAIGQLVRRHKIRIPFVVFSSRRVITVDPNNGDVQYKDRRLKPYSQLQQIVEEYETLIKPNDIPRWVIMARYESERLKRALNKIRLKKGDYLFSIVAAEVDYANTSGNSNGSAASPPEVAVKEVGSTPFDGVSRNSIIVQSSIVTPRLDDLLAKSINDEEGARNFFSGLFKKS